VLRRTESWANGRSRLRVTLRSPRLRTVLLVGSAAVLGALMASAALVTFWDRETGRRLAAESKLADRDRRVKELGSTNRDLQRLLARDATAIRQLEERTVTLQRSATTVRAAAGTVLKRNGALVARADSLHGRGGSLEQQAAAVSKLADTLGNDLVAVLAYVSNTSPASLDPAYLKAQLDYLKPAVAQVRSAAQELGSDADGYAGAVDAFAAQAVAYAAALRRLAQDR